MTVHRESANIDAVIAGLSHSSVVTKKTVLTTLLGDLDTEQGVLDTESTNLQAHRSKVSGIIDNLDVVSSAVEYTVSASGGAALPVGMAVYVDASYSGGSDDGSREKPFADLGAALDSKCAPADDVERVFLISAGVYTLAKTITKDVGKKQKVTFRGKGQGLTFLQAGANYAAGMGSDCLKLTNFGGIRVEELTLRRAKYGLRTVSCDDLHVRHVKFSQCGASDTATNFDHSLSQADQVARYAAEFTDGGALRADDCDGLVRVLDCHVADCNRGIRVRDSVKGGQISGCFVERTGQAGIYLSASTYTGATGCRNFTITGNTVINAGNNSVLLIGGRDNTVLENVLKGGWNCAVQLWSCCNTTISDNKIEKSNFSLWNGQGVLGDAHCSGVVAQGESAIFSGATYQCRITGNVITEPFAGRAPAKYAIRIMNNPFIDAATGLDADKVFCQGNHSQDADVHFQKDVAGVTVADMDSRSQPEASGIRKNTNFRVVTVTGAGDTPILASDWLVVITHNAVSSLTATLPSSPANGQIFVVKNACNDASGGTTATDIELLAPPGQTIDGRFSGILLKGSTTAANQVDTMSNQAARVVYDATANTFYSVSDAY